MSTNTIGFSFTYENGSAIKFYDDGVEGDQFYAFSESHGLVGIVRAASWEDAHGVCEDEFYSEAQEATMSAMAKECGVALTGDDTIDMDNLMNDASFQEGYGFRPNGPSTSDTMKHGVYAKDLNGDRLENLTVDMCEELGISVNVPGILLVVPYTPK